MLPPWKNTAIAAKLAIIVAETQNTGRFVNHDE
jgi:hypothetical protein